MVAHRTHLRHSLARVSMGREHMLRNPSSERASWIPARSRAGPPPAAPPLNGPRVACDGLSFVRNRTHIVGDAQQSAAQAVYGHAQSMPRIPGAICPCACRDRDPVGAGRTLGMSPSQMPVRNTTTQSGTKVLPSPAPPAAQPTPPISWCHSGQAVRQRLAEMGDEEPHGEQGASNTPSS